MVPLDVLQAPNWIWLCLVIFVSLIARYMLLAGGAMALLALFRNRVDPVRLQKQPITVRQIMRELGWSITSLAIFAVMLTALIKLHLQWPFLKVYPEFGQHGIAWEFIAFALLFFGHDAYFYAMHRLIHRPGVFERVHKVHHLSTNPTPLSAFAFHPSEAFLELAGAIALVCLIPISAPMVFAFSLVSLAYNVMGHLGVEIYPRWWLRHPVLGLFNSATVHNHHHRSFKGNYGLYTLIWDRLFGTYNPPRTLRPCARPTQSGIQAES